MNPFLSSMGHVCLLIFAMVPQDFRLMGNLAAQYVHAGRHQEAEAAFERTLDLMEKQASTDPYMAVLLSNFGTLYTQQGKYKQARKTLEKALDIAGKRLPKDHPNFATILTNLAGLAQRQGKWKEAESHLLSAMRIIDVSLPKDHRDRALALEHLGVVHFNQGKMSQAESELRRALDIERKIGSDDMRTTHIALNLANVLIRQRQYEEARLLYTAALPVQERLLGSNSAEVATTLELFSDLLLTMKSPEAAGKLQTRAKRIRAMLAYTISID